MVGQAFAFNGSNSCVIAPHSETWNFGRNDFTIELWANRNVVRPSTLIGASEGGGS